MSAFGGKADIERARKDVTLVTQSGHSTAPDFLALSLSSGFFEYASFDEGP
jgi:hypothetical protein